jgi:hypothetical protein
MHKNALVSVNMWKLENPNAVFYYQNCDATRDIAFTIGIQILWQNTTLLKYKRDGCNSTHATFSTTYLLR